MTGIALVRGRSNLDVKRLSMILAHSVKTLKTTFDARASEWALAVATLLLGVSFVFNETLFVDSGWRALAQFASQETWGFVCTTLGALRLLVLLINGAWWRSPHLRALMAFLSCFVWWQMSSDLVPNFALGFALLPPILALDAYNAIRAGREAGVAHYIQRRKVKAEARLAADDATNSDT